MWGSKLGFPSSFRTQAMDVGCLLCVWTLFSLRRALFREFMSIGCYFLVNCLRSRNLRVFVLYDLFKPFFFARPFFLFAPFAGHPSSSPFLGTFSPFSPPRRVLCSVEKRVQSRAWTGAVRGCTSPRSSGRKFLPEICVKKSQLKLTTPWLTLTKFDKNGLSLTTID